jgi:hypothetical protein
MERQNRRAGPPVSQGDRATATYATQTALLEAVGLGGRQGAGGESIRSPHSDAEWKRVGRQLGKEQVKAAKQPSKVRGHSEGRMGTHARSPMARKRGVRASATGPGKREESLLRTCKDATLTCTSEGGS